MRLTKKSTSDYIHNKMEKIRERMKEKISANPACEEMAYIETHERDELRYEKLGQLEDIEDELGIDLVVLFTALKKGVYIKKQSQTKYPLAMLRIHYSNHTTKYFVFDNGREIAIKLKDYGKTWALTREELE